MTLFRLREIARKHVIADLPGYMADKTSATYLVEFCTRAIHLAREGELPPDKLGRWVGFVQGVMCTRRWITVDGERDETRPIFNRPHTAWCKLRWRHCLSCSCRDGR